MPENNLFLLSTLLLILWIRLDKRSIDFKARRVSITEWMDSAAIFNVL
jgi:hypothetical protein